MPEERPFDIVLFGATGFTGGLTAEYLAGHAPEGTRWALAGRSPDKLEAVRERLAAIDPACAAIELMHADVDDADSLRAVAESHPRGRHDGRAVPCATASRSSPPARRPAPTTPT